MEEVRRCLRHEPRCVEIMLDGKDGDILRFRVYEISNLEWESRDWEATPSVR
jgi:hypothetical protein